MTILGYPGYMVKKGCIIFKEVDITHLPTNERVKLGIGMSFQHPPEIRGVKLGDMVQITLGKEKREGDKEVIALARRLNISTDFLSRDVNLGFSGGEVKKSEILQILAQSPEFIMFDEPDSGVDIENIELIGKIISELLDRNKRPSKRSKAGLVITHSGSIMQHLKADRAHVMIDGRMACSGMPDEITKNIMENGFEKCVELCSKEGRSE
jgi:Fe-S cluster assembly ATP-binding protein